MARAAALATLGHRTRLPTGATRTLLDALETDPDRRARAAALGALIRRGGPDTATHAWTVAARDPDPSLRRRAAELAPVLVSVASGAAPHARLIGLLDDPDVTVVEAAAWALGELPGGGAATAALTRVAGAHDDALAREAAVAALGARGDPEGLPAVLAACRDVATVRRRAVLALAPFEGPAVDAALAEASRDRDWQVRQAAEDLGAGGADPGAGDQ